MKLTLNEILTTEKRVAANIVYKTFESQWFNEPHSP